MALSTGRFVLGRVVSVAIVIVGVTGLTWLVVNALRPDLRAGDDRLIFVALLDYLQSVPPQRPADRRGGAGHDRVVRDPDGRVDVRRLRRVPRRRRARRAPVG
jgi:hypothetical protein